MYDHILHRGKYHFCRYVLQAFSAEAILKRHIKDCFRINGKWSKILKEKQSHHS